MKKIVIILFFFTFALAHSQSVYNTYTHEDAWLPPIGSSKTYLKIQVVTDGIHRVNISDLAPKGFSFSNETELQLFRRGVEQSIFISSGDYIEFYGRKNDGELDNELYAPDTIQPHPYHSLYTDTAAYFLTSTLGVTGKRVQDFSSTTVTPEAYHIEENFKLFTSTFHKGEDKGYQIRNPFSDKGEGWFSELIKTSFTFNFEGVENVLTSSFLPELKLQIIGATGEDSSDQHDIFIALSSDGTNFTSISNDVFNGYQVRNYSIPLTNSMISGSNQIFVRVTVAGTNNNGVAISYATLNYAQTIDMNGTDIKYFNIKDKSNGSTSTLNVINTPANSIAYFLRDGIYNRKVITGTNAELNIQHVNNELQKIFIQSTSTVEIVGLNELELTTLQMPDTMADFIIISHHKFENEAEEYADYRNSVSGGSYKTSINYIGDLSNIFTYGDFSSLAIRRFADYLISNGDNAKYLLLIGKGVEVNLKSGGEFYRNNPSASQLTIVRNGQSVNHYNYVPTPGHPGGDVWYTSNIVNDEWYPHIPTGRISGILNSEISAYLNKVVEFEATPDDLWKKRVLHLGGGANASEILNFKIFLNQLKNKAEDNYFGGSVNSIFKQTESAVEPITVDKEVNGGIALMTFFGHSTADQSDIDIGYVSDVTKGYNNKDGKYPVILINGCNAGSYYKKNYAFAEDWVLTAEKGAIAVLASSTVGVSNTLKNYSRNFYDVAFNDTLFLQSSIGNIQKEIIKNLNFINNDRYNLGHTLNTNILGDPSISVFGNKKPDLETNNQTVFIQPVNEEVVTAVSDTFNVGVIVRNFGRYSLADSFFISIQREYNGIIDNYTKIYDAVSYSDTLYFGFSTKSIQTFGLNNFKIKVDYYEPLNISLVDESNEDNNEANLQYFMPLSGVYPLFPKEFEMIGENNSAYPNPWSLIAQSTDLMVEQTNYYFEIDTTTTFKSSLMASATVLGGAEVTWDSPPLTSMISSIQSTQNRNDSIVFYWRVRFSELQAGEDTIYGNSSFQYNFQSSGGWAQSHFYQFKRDKQKFLEISTETKRSWELEKIKVSLEVKTGGPSLPDGDIPRIVLNNSNPTYIGSLDSYRKNGFLVTTIDGETFDYIDIADYGNRAQYPTGAGFQYGFRFNNSSEMDEFCQYISDVKCGDYVVVVTRKRSDFNAMLAATPLVATRLSEIGAVVDLSSLVDSQGYVLVGRKCQAAEFESVLDSNEFFDSTFVLSSFLTNGTNTSTIIGPVTKWGKMYRHVKRLNNDNEWGIEIHGLNLERTESSLLHSDVKKAGYDLSDINPHDYPYLRLTINKRDDVNRVPPQLKNWIVTYEAEIPEGTIVAGAEVDNYETIELYEGDKKTYNFRFKNISNFEFAHDLDVHVSIVSASGASIPEKKIIQKPAPGEFVDFQYELKTEGLEGNYNLMVTFNPSIQLEHYYHNNSFAVPFSVKADNLHPILDVTFDGTHIMDYDIVSPSPKIVIKMKDENNFLPKNNTDGITFFYKNSYQVQNPNSGQTTIDLNSPDVEVNFASEDGAEDFSIAFTPSSNLPNDVYKLYVQVTDRAGNESGSLAYEVHFEVINETTMTNFFPYPNPFSTSMRFAYTLTGAKQPDQIKIQIMTISGKIVREITQYELGELKIGKHLTDFVWDGTDEFGSKLANGVYLYNVITNMKDDATELYNSIEFRDAGNHKVNDKGETIEKSNSDKLLKKGWGKLYIMR